ncbi:MAG: hypothetical protein NTX72_00185 [Candidatus Uhrbacteria bacterium]|nr:hypothetical protein [Candidatus Uhrbacteria bacterium]
MERFRQEAHFQAAKEAAREKGKEGKELESDRVVLEAAYQKALETETDQIQVEDFEGVYGKKQLRAQAKEVERLRGIFDHGSANPEMGEMRQLGKILEAIVIEQIELNEWLGPNINTQQTCEYDDYANGIDFVTEFNEDGALRHMGFAIDATHGKGQVIRLKLEKIRSQLNRGELGEMTYFQTVDQSIQGRKRFIPKIVLALEKQHVVDIARLWVQGNQTALAEHPVRQTIMKEIVDQLAGQLAYAHALEASGNPKAAKLVEVLSAQYGAMQRTASRVSPSKISYVDQGAETIKNSVKNVFDPENVERMEELELKLKIAKKKKAALPTFDLENKLQKLLVQKEHTKSSQDKAQTIENKGVGVVTEVVTPEVSKKKQTRAEFFKGLGEHKGIWPKERLVRLSIEKQQERYDILVQRLALGDISIAGELRFFRGALGFGKELLKQKPEQQPEVAPIVKQTEFPNGVPTKKELVARYESLIRQRKQGDISVDPEIKFLAKEFERLRELNKAKAALEQRVALEKKANQKLAA